MTITAAADGSALGNPGPAGWAWYVDDGCWASGGWPRGTNNMGELMAVLDLLRQTAHVDDDLLVYCDSTYVINVVTKWMAGWKRKGWRKGDGKPVMNVDLIQAIDVAVKGRRVRFEWVKGHAGHPLNEEADERAVAASTAFQARRPHDPGPGYPGAAAGVPVDPVEAEEDLLSFAEVAPVAAAAPASVTSSADPLDEVVALERALLTDAVRADPAAVGALLDPAWTEFGASGRRWTRAEMLATLPDAASIGNADLEVLSVEPLARDLVLLLWRSHTDAGTSLRSSVWVRSGGRWRQRFHQGTPEGAGRAR
ncbi:MAG TPA: RNase H family protein [Friedmanniella sp.]